jgi:hypothetical protein
VARRVKSSPNALSTIAIPPDAVPVSPASTFMETANETSGPPSIENTASRTNANAGNAATTAPKPTRLAIISIGKAAEFAPASRLSRGDGKRRKLMRMTVKFAAARATMTDQTPDTAPIVVPPHRCSDRNEKSSRGKTTSDIKKFVAMTTTRGSTARAKGGPCSARLPCGNSAGSKSPAGAACSRTISSTTGVVPASPS